MSTLLFANNAASALSGGITSTATTCVLASGTGALFPNPGAGQYFVMTFTDAATGLFNEIVWVTARAGDTLTIQRGQESTSPLSWLAGDFARNQLTAGQMSALYQTGAYQGQQTTGYLQYVSTTQIAFVPKGGDIIIVDGLVYNLPSGGLTSGLTNVHVGGVAAQNLASSTVYDVFIFNNSGTLTFDFWSTTTGVHMTDTSAGNIGIEVRSNSGTPDSTRSYIGKIATNATPNFQVQGIGVISWFRQELLSLVGANESGTATTTSYTEISSAARISFLSFGVNAIDLILSSGAASVTGGTFTLSWAIDGAAVGLQSVTTLTSASTVPVLTSSALAEGSHYGTLFGKASSTQTGTISNFALNVKCWG